MNGRPDAGLEVALEQRRRLLEEAQQVLSERERRVQREAATLAAWEQQVRAVLEQIDSAQQPAADRPLNVVTLGDLERLLLRCEEQVHRQNEQLAVVRADADKARGGVATAHQQVRVLELVLESRAAARAEHQRRVEQRLADETAARVARQAARR
jgi:flagellar export protein FliJ